MTDQPRTFVYGGAFDTAGAALEALAATRALASEGRVHVVEAAAFERTNGEVRFVTAMSAAMDRWAKIGAVADATAGLVLLGPLGGLAGVMTGGLGGLLFGSLLGNLRSSTIAPLGAELPDGAAGVFVVARVEPGVRSDMLLPGASCRARLEFESAADLAGTIAELGHAVMAKAPCD